MRRPTWCSRCWTSGDLYGVSDTAQVLADDVIERADADAAAVLSPMADLARERGVGLLPWSGDSS